MADELIVGDEQVVYADRAYDSAARRERLRALGVADGIMRRANKHHPQLPPETRQRNRRLARLRMPVEQIFATFKRVYRYRRVRYRGLAQNTTELELKCVAYNLRRLCRNASPATHRTDRAMSYASVSLRGSGELGCAWDGFGVLV